MIKTLSVAFLIYSNPPHINSSGYSPMEFYSDLNVYSQHYGGDSNISHLPVDRSITDSSDLKNLTLTLRCRDTDKPNDQSCVIMQSACHAPHCWHFDIGPGRNIAPQPPEEPTPEPEDPTPGQVNTLVRNLRNAGFVNLLPTQGVGQLNLFINDVALSMRSFRTNLNILVNYVESLPENWSDNLTGTQKQQVTQSIEIMLGKYTTGIEAIEASIINSMLTEFQPLPSGDPFARLFGIMIELGAVFVAGGKGMLGKLFEGDPGQKKFNPKKFYDASGGFLVGSAILGNRFMSGKSEEDFTPYGTGFDPSIEYDSFYNWINNDKWGNFGDFIEDFDVDQAVIDGAAESFSRLENIFNKFNYITYLRGYGQPVEVHTVRPVNFNLIPGEWEWKVSVSHSDNPANYCRTANLTGDLMINDVANPDHIDFNNAATRSLMHHAIVRLYASDDTLILKYKVHNWYRYRDDNSDPNRPYVCLDEDDDWSPNHCPRIFDGDMVFNPDVLTGDVSADGPCLY